MSEIFKQSKTVPHYMVSDGGRIYNTQSGKFLHGRVNKRTGYPEVVAYWGNGRRSYHLVHRLIAEMFCEKPDGEGYEVNHKNGDRTDARAENLEWITHSENLHHSYVTGRREYDVAPKGVVAKDMATGVETIFPSIYRAARALKISQGNICMCCKGLRPFANGYYWRYATEGE